MMKVLFFFTLLLTGFVSCKKNEITPEVIPVTPAPVVATITYADSVAGSYTGIDVYYHQWLETGENGYDTTFATANVTIDSSASNRVIINADTFDLDSVNHFRTIHPSGDWHVFNEGQFTLDSTGGATLLWQKGSHYLSSAHIHTFTGSR